MKKIFCIFFLTLILLSACTPYPTGTPAPDNSPVQSADIYDDAYARAELYATPLIRAALAALEAAPSGELSDVTYPFEAEYAYSGPTDEQVQFYTSVSDKAYAEDDAEYFESVCDLVIENIPQDASAYDKYRYLAFFLSAATDYDMKGTAGLMSVTPYGAIVGGKSVCLGYANTYLYLCEKANLWCKRVDGCSAEGDHSWNLVKLEDGTYYVDVTWCDGLDAIGTKEWQAYFMLTENALLLDHGIWSGGPATGENIFG